MKAASFLFLFYPFLALSEPLAVKPIIIEPEEHFNTYIHPSFVISEEREIISEQEIEPKEEVKKQDINPVRRSRYVTPLSRPYAVITESQILFQNRSGLEKLSRRARNSELLAKIAEDEGNITSLLSLVRAGKSANSLNAVKVPALSLAITAKNNLAVKFLLNYNADPDLQDLSGFSPVHYAVKNGNIEALRLLISYRADIDIADNDGYTPLMLAAFINNLDAAKILLANGADISARDRVGQTAFDISRRARHSEFMNLLRR